ncbi:MAG: hypothetical protein ABFE01_16175, partial [Phycisphaerales bacterium]
MYPSLMIVACVLFGTVLSGILHELGHAIAGKMAGLDVVCIQIFPPGLRLSGEPIGFWNAAISISGMLFAVLAGLAGTFVVLGLEGKWPCIRYAVWLFIPMMAQALPWLCLPWITVFRVNTRDGGDGDIQRFMRHTGWPTWAVSLIGLTLV